MKNSDYFLKEPIKPGITTFPGKLNEEDKTLFKNKINEDQQAIQKFKQSKILLVGAGGIGCEVLKDLVLVGFSEISTIDLDTIDVSNLNRQFLFRRKHVSQPKAIVARESALEFNPNCNIQAYHDSIFSTQFGVGYFKEFKLVINALDNRAARNHVNRLCLAAEVPLIETGTSGYHGQVEVILKGITQCYECQPKQPQKTYPGCTIRNTPSEPVHCIVWAKHLFNQLFGEEDADNEVSPDSSDPELKKDGVPMEVEEKGDGNVERTSTRVWARSEEYNPELLHKKFFVDDIKYLLTMESLWKERRAPTPSSIIVAALQNPDKKYQGLDRTMKVWDWETCTKVFVDSLEILAKRYSDLELGDYLTWDKDDEVALDFVSACANIRCYIFGITPKSKFDVKAIAGNIIPAIASTNAIVSGLAVLQATRILMGDMKSCTVTHLRKHPNPYGELFKPERQVIPPNKNCYVCAPKPQVTLELDVNQTTVQQFEDLVLKKTLNMIAPDVVIPAKSLIVISSDEDDDTLNADKPLKEVGITEGVILHADDFLQEYNVTIVIKHKAQESGDFYVKILTSNKEFQDTDNETKRPSDESEPDVGPSRKLAKISIETES